MRDLKAIQYIAMKPFEFSMGLHQDPLHHQGLLGALQNYEHEGQSARVMLNPGSSDATIISASLSDRCRGKTTFIVAGPGCRSNNAVFPPRLTHGPNETLYISHAKCAIARLVMALYTTQHISPSAEHP